MRSVGQPIQQRSSHFLIPKDLIPIPEAQIGRHNQGYSFVEVTTHLEQELAAFSTKRDKSQFIENHQVQPFQLLDDFGKTQFLLGSKQVVDQGIDGEKEHLLPLLSGGKC